MLTEHLTFGYLLVVLKLARIACEESGCNGADTCFAAMRKKLPDHHRLVDVRHSHPFSDEVAHVRTTTPLSPSGVEERTATLPFAVLEGSFKCVSGCPIWQHDKPVAEVLMDVSAHECIHLVTPCVAVQACVNALGFISAAGLRRYPSSRPDEESFVLTRCAGIAASECASAAVQFRALKLSSEAE